MAYIDNVNKVLNIQPEAAPTRVRLSQNENGRNLYFTLAGNENPIPSGVTVTISGTKPDGTVYSGIGSISNDVVLIPETVQLTAVAGVWDAKVKITSGGNTVATGRIRFLIDADTVAPGSVPSSSVLEGLVEQAQQYAETARQEAYGSPLTAATSSAMTDKTRVYVYTGSETGYTFGNWYYWNGTAWTSGGVYNNVAIEDDLFAKIVKFTDTEPIDDRTRIWLKDDETEYEIPEMEELEAIEEMIAGIEPTTTASKAYSVGDLVIVNDVLYKVTSAISAGTLLKPSNTTQTTIADVIKYESTDIRSRLYESVNDLESSIDGLTSELADVKGDLSYVYDEKALFVGDWKIGLIGGSVGSEIQFNPAFTNRVSLTTPQLFDYTITAYIQAGYKATFYFLDSNNVILSFKYVNENSTITIDPETRFEILIEKVPIEAVGDKINKYIQAVPRTMHGFLLYEAVDNASAKIRSNQLALENLYSGAMYLPDMVNGATNATTGNYDPNYKNHITTPDWFVPEHPYAIKITDDNYSCRLIYNDSGTITFESLTTNGNVLFPNRQTKIDLWKNESNAALDVDDAKNILSLQSIDDYLAKKSSAKLDKIKNGYDLFDAFVRRGGLGSGSGQYLNYVNYRCTTPEIVRFAQETTISAETGFRFDVMLFDSDDSFVSDLGWKTYHTISAGQGFKLIIARATENTAEYADVDEFVYALNVDTIYVTKEELSSFTLPLFERGFLQNGGKPHLAAHGGYHVGYPYNSNPAFEAAGKNSFWGIEADVNETEDGYLVMIHDTTVDSSTDDTGAVNEKTLEEIRALQLKGTDYQIPLFEEYLAICKRYSCVPYIEIKATVTHNGIVKLIETLKTFGLDKTSIISGSKWNLANVRAVTQTIPYLSIYQNGFSANFDTELAFNKAYPDTGIEWDYLNGVDLVKAKSLHDNGMLFTSFTIDDANDVLTAFENGVDFVITNFVLPTTVTN